MSSGKEDYLKALYYLGKDSKPVSNKDLANYLNIKAPSVSEMVLKLQKEGYIDYEPYKGSVIKEKGITEALQITRYHRLWEVFLTKYLGYSWSEAHHEAHSLEHVTSMMLAKRLDNFMGNPSVCPHGKFIPREDLKMQTINTTPLSDLLVGEIGKIATVKEEVELLDYLQKLGIKIGSEVEVLKKDGYGGNYTVKIDGEIKSISKQATEGIYIKQKDEV